MSSRKSLAVLLAIMSLVLLVAACAGATPQPAAPTEPAEAEQPSSAEEPAPAPSAELEEAVIGLNIGANTLDPHFISSTQEYGILKNVFEHLVWINHETGGFDPRLATSWEQIDDLTWEFELREGVTFQNGEPFNAEAVKYTIERTVDPEVGSNNRFPGAVHFDHVEVVDEYTVRIITTQPAPTMLTQLWILQIVPPDYYSNTPLEELARNPVGTGPYKLVEWVKDDHMTFETWDGYWGEQPPVKRVIYRPLPEISTRLAELETGGVDIAIDVSPDNMQTLEDLENIDVRTVKSGRRVFFGLRSDRAPLNSVQVRQALNYGLNWDSINRNILNGIGERMATYVTGPHRNPELEPYPYDPEKAKELLAEAGYADGFEMTLEVPVARYLKGEEISQAAAADWEDLSIEVNVVPLEWSVYVQKVILKKDPDGAFLLGLSSAFNPYDDLNNLHPDFVFANYHWEDQEYLDLLDEYPTADEERRQEISYEAQKIVHDRGPLVMLWKQVQIYGVNDRLGWQPRPDDYIIAEDIGPAQ